MSRLNKCKNAIAMLMVMIFMTMFCSVRTYAAEPSDSTSSTESEQVMGYTYLKATYTDNLTPMPGDTFEITYCVVGNEDEYSTITVDAYDIYKEPKLIGLPEGQTYEITRLKSTGANGGIVSYCIQSSFNVHSDPQYYGTVTLTIGIDDVQPRYDGNVYIVASGVVTDKMLSSIPVKTKEEYMQEYRNKENNRTKIATRSSTEQQEQTEAISKTVTTEVTTQSQDVYEEEYGDDYGIEIQDEASDEPSIEVYTTESTQESESNRDDNDAAKTGKPVAILIILIAALAIGTVVVIKGRNSGV